MQLCFFKQKWYLKNNPIDPKFFSGFFSYILQRHNKKDLAKKFHTTV